MEPREPRRRSWLSVVLVGAAGAVLMSAVCTGVYAASARAGSVQADAGQPRLPICNGMVCTSDDDCGTHCTCDNPSGMRAKGRCVAKKQPANACVAGPCKTSKDCGAGCECRFPNGKRGQGVCSSKAAKRGRS